MFTKLNADLHCSDLVRDQCPRLKRLLPIKSYCIGGRFQCPFFGCTSFGSFQTNSQWLFVSVFTQSRTLNSPKNLAGIGTNKD